MNHSFIKNMLTALKNAGDIGVHVTEVEIARPWIRTQMRIRFHLIANSPGLNTEEACKNLEVDERLVLDNKHHNLPAYYFTFSSKYSTAKNLGELCRSISRIIHGHS